MPKTLAQAQADLQRLQADLAATRSELKDAAARLASDPSRRNAGQVDGLYALERQLLEAIPYARRNVELAREQEHGAQTEQVRENVSRDLAAVADPAARIDAALDALRDAVSAFAESEATAQRSVAELWRRVRPQRAAGSARPPEFDFLRSMTAAIGAKLADSLKPLPELAQPLLGQWSLRDINGAIRATPAVTEALADRISRARAAFDAAERESAEEAAEFAQAMRALEQNEAEKEVQA